MSKSGKNRMAQWSFALCALLFTVTPARIYADVPGPHPGYLHAIRDLREARELLQTNWGNPRHAQAASAIIQEIDLAIGDLKHASRLDEKSLAAVPPSKGMAPEGRFHKVQILLNESRTDISRPESDPVAVPHRDHALEHINNSLRTVGTVV